MEADLSKVESVDTHQQHVVVPVAVVQALNIEVAHWADVLLSTVASHGVLGSQKSRV